MYFCSYVLLHWKTEACGPCRPDVCYFTPPCGVCLPSALLCTRALLPHVKKMQQKHFVWSFHTLACLMVYFLFNNFSTSSFLEQIHGLYIIEFIKTNKELIIPGGQPSEVRINVQIWTIGLRSYHADLILLLYLENVGYLYPLLAASWPLLWARHPFIWKIYVPWLVREADVQ